MSDDEIGDVIGQRGYLLNTGDDLNEAAERQSNGQSAGILVSAIAFLTFLIVEPSYFWGWDLVEETHSRAWYALPGLLALGTLEFWKKSAFWSVVILTLVVGYGFWYFGYENWGAVAVIVLALSSVSTPQRKYGLYRNTGAINKIKNVIHSNCNFVVENIHLLRELVK